MLVDSPKIERDPLDLDPVAVELPRGWLGGSIAWAIRQDVAHLHIVTDVANGGDARRSKWFRDPPTIWRVEGREAVQVRSLSYEPPEPPDAVTELFREVIEAAGADVVVEGGTMRAEVLGLEVARVICDADGIPQLAVGVGRHDRLAQAMLYGTDDVDVSLRTAVASVLDRRHGDAGSHPANQLAAQRWLRAVVVHDPRLVGARQLRPVTGTVEPRLKRQTPAIAVGTSDDGAPVVVATSVGVDLDALGDAADARAVHADATTSLVLVVPEGDDFPAVRELAARLVVPASVVTVPRGWRSLPTGR